MILVSEFTDDFQYSVTQQAEEWNPKTRIRTLPGFILRYYSNRREFATAAYYRTLKGAKIALANYRRQDRRSTIPSDTSE